MKSDLRVWEGELSREKWNLTLRVEGFGIAFIKTDSTEKKFGLGRLRFFNS